MFMCMFYISIIYVLSCADRHDDVYIHIGVGFCVARCTEQGNAKAFMRGMSNSTDPHVFSSKLEPQTKFWEVHEFNKNRINDRWL